MKSYDKSPFTFLTLKNMYKNEKTKEYNKEIFINIIDNSNNILFISFN